MCQTEVHRVFDAALVEMGAELPFELIRDHPYDDECCRIEAGDHPPRWKDDYTPERCLMATPDEFCEHWRRMTNGVENIPGATNKGRLIMNVQERVANGAAWLDLLKLRAETGTWSDVDD